LALKGLAIRLLGSLEVRRNGEALELPASRKSRALLAYLVATGRAHSRSHLCGLLWDGPDDPRAALRWSLTKLRPLVDGPK
jgi:DNA-binding SARP family transcriptional activator